MARGRSATGAGAPGVEIRNLAAFRRGLRNLDRDLDKQLGRYIREIAKETRDEARRRTPVGRSDRRSKRQRKPGTLRKSIRHSVTQKRATLFSDQPDAAVHEWGGTIKPRGVPIEIRGKRMIWGAIDHKAEDVEQHMGRMFDAISNSSG